MEKFSKKQMNELGRLSIIEYKQRNQSNSIVILDNIRSMENVGSVFRTCDGFGISELLLIGVTPKPPHRNIHKAALGATESVNWKHFENIQEAIKYIKSKGDYQIISIEQTHNSENLFEQNLTGNLCFIFGNEVEGVSKEALSHSAKVLEIPQIGTKHSFNISVSVGIILGFQFYKTHF